jgi:ATP-dependent RNA helicase DDX27
MSDFIMTIADDGDDENNVEVDEALSSFRLLEQLRSNAPAFQSSSSTAAADSKNKKTMKKKNGTTVVDNGSSEEEEEKEDDDDEDEDDEEDAINPDFSFNAPDEIEERRRRRLEESQLMAQEIENGVDRKIELRIQQRKKHAVEEPKEETTAAAASSDNKSSTTTSNSSASIVPSAAPAVVHVESSLSFEDLKLSRPLLRAIERLGWQHPTPIQAKAIPVALKGHDICGSAMTGSGKTAAFVLPILERLLGRDAHFRAVRALILSPTRELAQQSHDVIEQLAQFTDLHSCLIIGGVSNKQQEALLRRQPDIVVATPGRIIDHLRNARSVDFDDLEVLVLDEADRLLELGFAQELQEIVRFLPGGGGGKRGGGGGGGSQRQTLLYSATMTEDVDKLIALSMRDPVRISADPAYNVAPTLRQEFVVVSTVDEPTREAQLLALCARSVQRRALLFFHERWEVHRFKIVFGLCGLRAGELHGDMTQAARLNALEQFRAEKFDFLLTTDLASRGLDIDGVEVGGFFFN